MIRRPSLFRNGWAAPFALSAAVHGGIAAGALGLLGGVEPPRPETAMPVELVFAAAPADPTTASGAAAASPSAPAQASAARTGDAPARRASQTPPSPPEASPPAERRDRAATGRPPPLPRRKPAPPDEAVARAPAASPTKPAAPEAPDPAKGYYAKPASILPNTPESGPGPAHPPVAQQASRTGAAAMVPPGWGVPGLANQPPAYPTAARRRGIEGRVVLRVRVAASGAVEAVGIAASSGHALLDEAARHAVERWRFVPGRVGGVAVAASVDVPIVFRLTER